ncbi:hypothetical protein BJ085DRAFT_37439 [Dimargaris cristalligena]|uniref:RRM domain-containing protein n=1 Tax=Dimargaris cristalligena TaxID=215637 RepID=A0A4Q0A302_9FUNG|nr:hypothetical protein BJ085DRAFT_37439 [Dimargaris cristalligena]|eukprot:RKP40228.1 hypothetical protein BJ085DRAFT_37439 [Dimargaris cristalligena]
MGRLSRVIRLTVLPIGTTVLAVVVASARPSVDEAAVIRPGLTTRTARAPTGLPPVNQPDVQQGTLDPYFRKYGDLFDICDHLSHRGIGYFSYYDIRNAIRALEELNGKEIDGVPLDIQFSFPKDDKALTDICDRRSNQGTLLVTVRDDNRPVDDDELRRFFQQYGDVKDIKPFRENVRQRVLEFYDSRDCVKAHDYATGAQYNHGTIDCRFLWDLAQKSMSRYSKPMHARGRGGASHYSDREYNNHYEDDRSSRSHYEGSSQRSRSPAPRHHPYQHSRDDSRTRYGPPESRGSISSEFKNPSPASGRPPTTHYENAPAAEPSQTVDAERLKQAQQAQQVLSLLAAQTQTPVQAQPSVAQNPLMSLMGPQGAQVAQLLSLLAQQQQLQPQPQQPIHSQPPAQASFQMPKYGSDLDNPELCAVLCCVISADYFLNSNGTEFGNFSGCTYTDCPGGPVVHGTCAHIYTGYFAFPGSFFSSPIHHVYCTNIPGRPH